MTLHDTITSLEARRDGVNAGHEARRGSGSYVTLNDPCMIVLCGSHTNL